MSHDNEKGFEMNEDLGEAEFAGLAQALRASRPAPEPEFTERLDQAVADRFPPEWADEAALGKRGKGGIGNLGERFRRRLGGRRILLPAMAGFAGLLVIATVVVAAVDSGRFGLGGDGGDESDPVAHTMSDNAESRSMSENASGETSKQGEPAAAKAGGPTPDVAVPSSANGATAMMPAARLDRESFPDSRRQLSKGGSRDIAREAEITLGTDPNGVQDVANQVVAVTDDHNGIVMDSKVTDGEEGTAGATFRLLIPAGQMESAVADLSEIADLRSRSQELTDITAPVTRTEDSIADSKARIASLLGELEETYDEDERAAIEQKIRWERNDLRWQETRLKRLERRIDFTPIGLEVVTGGDAGSGDGSSSWGLSDAIDDAGKLLGVAAGVTVLALAVAIPIGIVVLIALALNRAWVRRSRRRVLADE